mmetsp:Transcript_18779/g.34898  ORF Transcript_18779/g.34898 Transcript_18779/m.34898 type:complete len:310 (+) Transcript_18779:262-1191(+)
MVTKHKIPVVESDGPLRKKGHPLCSKAGCTNYVRQGGLCSRHGAFTTRKICTHEGCSKFAKKGGVCVTHGAKVKRCHNEGCNNQAVEGGVCRRHDAKSSRQKNCGWEEGCTSRVVKGGLCRRHYGAKFNAGIHEGCMNKPKDEWFRKNHHGAAGDVYTRSRGGCTENDLRKEGVCISHGANVNTLYRESDTNRARSGELYLRHGATGGGSSNDFLKEKVCVFKYEKSIRTIQKGTCKQEEYENTIKTGGVSINHGENTETSPGHEGCTDFSKEGGVCCTRYGAEKKPAAGHGIAHPGSREKEDFVQVWI